MPDKVTLGSLKPAKGSTQSRKRVGRGPGSGIGKTSGKGHKGHKARTGGQTRPGFEGGQMPLTRRVPKRGFTNPFKTANQVVNLKALAVFANGEITPEILEGKGLVASASEPIKILGDGESPRGLVVRGLAVSGAARAKIEAAGGRIEA
ncbi:MAG TPA: 50S ribosomal protein L15 [Gemmatimonadales bacterium]|nr:50S ribosomal protein L15 [Gemmatimonadales bacterium]